MRQITSGEFYILPCHHFYNKFYKQLDGLLYNQICNQPEIQILIQLSGQINEQLKRKLE